MEVLDKPPDIQAEPKKNSPELQTSKLYFVPSTIPLYNIYMSEIISRKSSVHSLYLT